MDTFEKNVISSKTASVLCLHSLRYTLPGYMHRHFIIQRCHISVIAHKYSTMTVFTLILKYVGSKSLQNMNNSANFFRHFKKSCRIKVPFFVLIYNFLYHGMHGRVLKRNVPHQFLHIASLSFFFNPLLLQGYS